MAWRLFTKTVIASLNWTFSSPKRLKLKASPGHSLRAKHQSWRDSRLAFSISAVRSCLRSSAVWTLHACIKDQTKVEHFSASDLKPGNPLLIKFRCSLQEASSKRQQTPSNTTLNWSALIYFYEPCNLFLCITHIFIWTTQSISLLYYSLA